MDLFGSSLSLNDGLNVGASMFQMQAKKIVHLMDTLNPDVFWLLVNLKLTPMLCLCDSLAFC
jgi:hypothetical protein